MIFGIKEKSVCQFDPYNVFLAIATNIPQRLKTGFVVQGHIYGLYTNHSPSFSGLPTWMTNINFCHLLVWRDFFPSYSYASYFWPRSRQCEATPQSAFVTASVGLVCLCLYIAIQCSNCQCLCIEGERGSIDECHLEKYEWVWLIIANHNTSFISFMAKYKQLEWPPSLTADLKCLVFISETDHLILL